MNLTDISRRSIVQLRALVILALTAVAVASCGSSHKNGDVIPKKKMIGLMADTHRAEAIIDMAYGKYSTDSARAALRQSVYVKYGVTQAQFDSSLMYYGAHLDQYNEIYEAVLEQLQKESDRLAASATDYVAVGGDSVNIWNISPYQRVSPRMSPSMLTFSLTADETWRRGDSYTLQFRIVNKGAAARAGIFMNYDDGSVEMITSTADDASPKTELTLVADTTKVPLGVYGYTVIEARADADALVDSLALVRRHFDESTYNKRYNSTLFHHKPVNPIPDNTSTNQNENLIATPGQASANRPAASSGSRKIQQVLNSDRR